MGHRNNFSHPPTLRKRLPGSQEGRSRPQPSSFALSVTLVSGNPHRRRLPKVQPAVADRLCAQGERVG
jgi:hypothetical protein